MIALSFYKNGAAPRLTDLCADFFALILHLLQDDSANVPRPREETTTLPEKTAEENSLHAHEDADPQPAGTKWGSFLSLREKIKQRFESMEREAKKHELASQDVQEAKFALVAFLDEIILNSDWAHKDEWREWPLQLEYFKTNTAGHEFFERLDRLRNQRETKTELLEIYYLCLTLGFKGEFELFGKDNLPQRIKAVAGDFQQLRPMNNGALAPHAQRPADEVARKKRPAVPAWLVIVLCVLVTMVFTLVLWEMR